MNIASLVVLAAVSSRWSVWLTGDEL